MDWLQLPEHRQSEEYEKYSACYQYVLPSLLEVYRKHTLIPDFDLSGGEEVVEENRVFVKDMAAFASKRRFDS